MSPGDPAAIDVLLEECRRSRNGSTPAELADARRRRPGDRHPPARAAAARRRAPRCPGRRPQRPRVAPDPTSSSGCPSPPTPPPHRDRLQRGLQLEPRGAHAPAAGPRERHRPARRVPGVGCHATVSAERDRSQRSRHQDHNVSITSRKDGAATVARTVTTGPGAAWAVRPTPATASAASRRPPVTVHEVEPSVVVRAEPGGRHPRRRHPARQRTRPAGAGRVPAILAAHPTARTTCPRRDAADGGGTHRSTGSCARPDRSSSPR